MTFWCRCFQSFLCLCHSPAACVPNISPQLLTELISSFFTAFSPYPRSRSHPPLWWASGSFQSSALQCQSAGEWTSLSVTLEWGQRLFLLWWWWVFSFFWSYHMLCEILVSPPGIKPTVEAQSLKHWTTRDVPSLAYFEFHWTPPTPPSVSRLFVPYPSALESEWVARALFLGLHASTLLPSNHFLEGSIDT